MKKTMVTPNMAADLLEPDPEKRIVKMALAMQEWEEITKPLLIVIRNAGYKKVWLGNVPNPHSQMLCGPSHIVAEPKRRRGSWPSLWDAVKPLFGSSCGNGLEKADQIQMRKYINLTGGEYDLTTWNGEPPW